MEIRLVKEGDLKELSRIFAESFTEADPNKPWTQERSFSLLEHFYKIQPDLFSVAIEADLLVGAVMAKIKPWREGNRCTEGVIFVDSAFQRKGFGGQLFSRLLEEVINKYQANTIEGITFNKEEFPLTWYEKIGHKRDKHAVLLKGDTREMLENLRK
jgi:GNAT superfamily N-acetyltransferase